MGAQRAGLISLIVVATIFSMFGKSGAQAAGPIALDPPPELSTGSTNADGISVRVSDLRSEEVQKVLVELNWLGHDRVYRIVHVSLKNHSDKTYFASPLDFHMLASDAASYNSFASLPKQGFPNGKGRLEPGESAETDIAFPLPRSKVAAAITWGTPSLIGDHLALGAIIGTRVILIPDKNGRPVAPLKPDGPIGSVSQLGATLRFDKAQILDVPASVRGRVPTGYVVEAISGTLENHTDSTVQVRTSDFVPLDSRGLPSAYILKANPLAMDDRYVKAGETLSGTLTYLVPADQRPIAMRWAPAGFIGKHAPSDMIVVLPK